MFPSPIVFRIADDVLLLARPVMASVSIAPTTSLKWKKDVLTNTTRYLKNRWTNHSLLCTHYDLFSMYIPNMIIKCTNSE